MIHPIQVNKTSQYSTTGSTNLTEREIRKKKKRPQKGGIGSVERVGMWEREGIPGSKIQTGVHMFKMHYLHVSNYQRLNIRYLLQERGERELNT